MKQFREHLESNPKKKAEKAAAGPAPVPKASPEIDHEAPRHSDGYDAMRDRVFSPPSDLSQIFTVCRTQMKRYTKEKTVWALVILLVLIPVVPLIFNVEAESVANLTMASLLCGMPFIVAFFCTQVSASSLPREFNERTVYFTLPLPISRLSFYLGKFLAALMLCFGMVVAAYGISAIMAFMDGGKIYTLPMIASMFVALVSVLFICSFTYMLSAHSKRGAGMISMILLVVLLPVLPYLLYLVIHALDAGADVGGMLDVLGYMPVYGLDMAVMYLGTPGIMFGSPLSAQGLGTSIGPMMGVSPHLCTSPAAMILICLVASVVCLYLGYVWIKRRDM